MPRYVDGFVIPIRKSNLVAYRRLAALMDPKGSCPSTASAWPTAASRPASTSEPEEFSGVGVDVPIDACLQAVALAKACVADVEIGDHPSVT